MANKHGDFIWYELMTNDADGARDFYCAVVGWDIEATSDAPMDYRMISASDGPVAGLMPLTAEMLSNGARPCWAGYINVDDVDASADAVKDGRCATLSAGADDERPLLDGGEHGATLDAAGTSSCFLVAASASSFPSLV